MTKMKDPQYKSKDIRLSQRDFEYFVSRLFEDEEPNDTMKQLAESYKEEFGKSYVLLHEDYLNKSTE